MTRHRLKAVVLALTLCHGTALAEPFTPKSDGEVLEQLPKRLAGSMKGVRTKEALATLPLAEALPLAREQIQLGRMNGDPRAFGRAEAILSRFTESAFPNPDALVLRATVRQFFHDFSGASADLEHALKLDPKNPQGWLTLSTIQTVRGEYDAAKKSCAKLMGRAPELITATCLSQIAGLTGDSKTAKDVLQRELSGSRSSLSRGELSWSNAILAELQSRTGEQAEAERLYRTALDIDPQDTGSRVALADLLLARGGAEETRALLIDHIANDGVLLRAVVAAKRSGQISEYSSLRAELESRMEAARLRGERTHLREEAIYQLHVVENPAAALEKAKANFEMQRETTDVLLLAECAARTNDRPTKVELSRWISERKMEFPQVVALVGGMS